MQTYDEKFENVKYFNSLLKWFNKLKIEKSFEFLSETINDLARFKKLNSLMHLYFVDRSLFPHDFDVYSIISECIREKRHSLDLVTTYHSKCKESKVLSKLKTNLNMFYQFINMELGIYLKNPVELASILNNYYLKVKEKEIEESNFSIEYIGFCTLPSIFGFFSIPDFYQYVYQLSTNINKYESLNNLNDYFCASFFFNTPKFLNFLWDDYFYQFLTGSIKHSPFKYFEYFLHSLKKASNFLVYYHYLIAKQIHDISPERFVRIMIKLVFLPTLEMRIISDAATHIYEIDQISCFTSLKYVFNYILEKPFLLGFTRSLLNAIKITLDTESNSQYVYPLKIVKFEYYVSIKELVYFGNLMLASNISANQNLCRFQTFPDFVLNDNSIIYSELYFSISKKDQEIKQNWQTIFYQEDKLFINNYQEIDIKNKNEIFFRFFNQCEKSLGEKGINIVSAIDDRFPIAQDKMSIVSHFRKCYPLLKDPEFKDFAISMVFNRYCNFFNILEHKMIINNIAESIYKDDLNSVIRLYFMNLNAFILFDDCFSTKSMRYKLTTLQSIKEGSFDEILRFLITFTVQYAGSVFDVLSSMEKKIEIKMAKTINENQNKENTNNDNNNNSSNGNNNNDINIEINSTGVNNNNNESDIIGSSINNSIECNDHESPSSVFDLPAFKCMKFGNPSLALKKFSVLKRISSFIVKMEMPDRIVMYSKLFRFIHELILSQDAYSSISQIDSDTEFDMNYSHNFIVIVIFIFSSVKLLMNLYETYCTFFECAFSQFDDDDDKEINKVKSEWIRFQKVLKQTIFKENKEYMDICLVK